MHSLSQRKQAGFALLTTLTLGLATIALMIALFPLLMTASQSETASRKSADLRTAAEAGIDYAMSHLNRCIPGTCPIDGHTTKLSPSELPGFGNIEISIRIRTLSPMDSGWSAFKAASAIYSPYLDSSLSSDNNAVTSQNYDNVPRSPYSKKDYWRVIESSATSNGFSQSIRVFAQPVFSDVSVYENGFLPELPPPNPYFKNAFFGNTSVDIDGPTEIKSSGPKLAIQSNKAIKIGAHTKIFGDVIVSNNVQGAPTVATGQTTSTIEGQLRTNGDYSGFKGTDGTQPPADNDNVRDLLDATPGRERNPINTSPVNNQLVPSPAPTNSDASSLSAALDANKELSGSYSVSNPNLKSGTQPPLTIDKPVQLFVTDALNSSNSNGLSFDSSAIRNNLSSGDLVLWYGGNRDIAINLSRPLKALIYAPNAHITLSGNSNFDGALVGNNVSLNNTGTVQINTASQTNQSSHPWLSETNRMENVDGMLARVPLGFKAVSWSEYSRKLIP